MRLPIDTGTVKLAAPGPAEPILDDEAQAPELDDNGTAIFTVPSLIGRQRLQNLRIRSDSSTVVSAL